MTLMSDFDKAQADNIKDFINANSKQTYLEDVQSKLDSINQVYNVIIGGKRLLETSIYNSYLPIFKSIYQKLVTKTIFTFATNAILEFSQPTGDSQSNSNSIIGGLLSLWGQTAPEDQNRLAAELFLPNEDIDRIVRGLQDYEAESNDTYKNKNPVLKKKRAVGLYKDAYEMYHKVIRNIYFRETGTDRKAIEEGRKNGDIRAYFSKNYPILIESVNNALRKDDSHLNYDERDKYTADEIMSSSNDVLTALITAIMAQLQVYKEIYEASAPVVGPFLDKFDQLGP